MAIRNMLASFTTWASPTSYLAVDQAGLERTEAGESAPSRLEDSPRPGRAKCELCETLQDLIMGAGEEASINLPCLLILAPSWMLGLPSPTRPSWRRRRGGHCANRPFCHSDGARDGEERITWRCATKRSASGLLRDALQPFLGAGEVGRAGVEGWKLAGRFEPPWIELSEVWVPGWTYFHNSDKEFALTMGGGCGMLEGGRHGAGEGYKEPEGGREADHRQHTQANS